MDAFVRLKDGCTLFMEIREKLMTTAKNGGRVSTRWWSQLRMKWSKVNSPESMLKVKVASDEVPAALVQALARATSSNTRDRTNQPLLSWLASVREIPSQKAVIGIFRHSLSCHPSGKHLQTCIGIIKLCARLKLYQTYPLECQAMHEHWDASLCSWLAQLRKSGLKDSVFMDQNIEVTSMVCRALR